MRDIVENPLGEAIIYGLLNNRTYALVHIAKKTNPLQTSDTSNENKPLIWYETFSSISEFDFRQMLKNYKLMEVDLINFGRIDPSDSSSFTDCVNAYIEKYFLAATKETTMSNLISLEEEDIMKRNLDDFLRNPFAEKPIF